METHLARTTPTLIQRNLHTTASALITAGVVVAFLYMGRPILEPLVIAALLAFILTPVIRRLHIWGVWRIPAIVLSVVLALALLALLSVIIIFQVTQLADDLPKHEANIRGKVRALSASAPWSSRVLDRASGTLRELQEEVTREAPLASGQKPLTVEIREPQPRGLEALSNLLRPLLSPLATTVLVILFLLFMLLQREDIRDRFVRLAGTADLQRTTAALDDAATRLSHLFLTQLSLNAGFGLVIAGGLWGIGVPNAVLWGILAGLMRFVPYIGSLIAAFFPLVLAIAIDPGWTMVWLTAALYIVAEPIAGHVVEPWLYGQRTGLSPVAIVVSSLFWTVLWGPVGLLLATPLTVCLVVLGKHIKALQFIDVLLGDEPALEPHERVYQRILAGDATEAADQAERELKTLSLSTYYDTVVMKALLLAQTDAALGKLSREKQLHIRDTIEEIVDDLSDYSDEVPPEADESGHAKAPLLPVISRGQMPDDWQIPYPVLCIASRSALDEAASIMLSQILEKHGVGAWVQPFADVAATRGFKVDVADANLVCLSYFGTATKPAHVRYLIRRIKREMPKARVLACFWMLGNDQSKVEQWVHAVGADLGATSLAESTAIIVNQALRPTGRDSTNIVDLRKSALETPAANS